MGWVVFDMLDAHSNNRKWQKTTDVFWAFLLLGLTSFGGPMAHIGYFRQAFVTRKQWVSESQFAQLLALCQCLPGPASSQLGFALGLLRAGWLGAVAAFLAFTLPSVLLLLGFIAVLPLLPEVVSETLLHSLKLVACVVVADAVVGMFKKLCTDPQRRLMAIMAAVVLVFFATAWMQIALIVVGAVAGLVFCQEPLAKNENSIKVSYGRRVSLFLFALFAIIFVLFIFSPYLFHLADIAHVAQVAEAFYVPGALVFGGGHVVLPLLEESVVGSGWVSKENFLAGYGAAQAIPGPLFAIAAYLGALIPTGYSAWVGASVALLSIFLPGYLLLAAALPGWQKISHNSGFMNAIAGINAVVVGILGAALYDPIITSGISSLGDVVIVIGGFFLLFFWRVSPLIIVLWCVLASLVTGLL